MTLRDIIKNPKTEFVKAGYCECGDLKYDVWLNQLHYGVIHLEIIKKVIPNFQEKLNY